MKTNITERINKYLNEKIDMKGKKCLKCKKGKYEETSIHDDWDGVLHCNKCGHKTKRHL